jgi:hypothetical protein
MVCYDAQLLGALVRNKLSKKRIPFLLGAGAIVLANGSVLAQTSAEALFEQGRVALAAGDLETACARFRDSTKLDPHHPGPFANLGKCEEQRGHLASASAAYGEAIALLPQDDGRRPVLQELVKALEPRLSKVVLDLSPGVPDQTTVTESGESLQTDGAPRPLNSGAHHLVVHAPLRADRVLDVVLGEGETKHVWVESGPAPVTYPLRPAPPSPGPPANTSASPGPWIVGGLGVTSLVVGAITGGLAIHEHALNATGCSLVMMNCEPPGKSAATTGRTVQAVSVTTLIAGGVGVVGSTVWFGLRSWGRRTSAPGAGVGLGPLLGGGAARLAGSW